MLAPARHWDTAYGLYELKITLVNNGVETVVKTGVFDTGIYNLDFPAEADTIRINRIGAYGGSSFDLAHIRAYQSKSLLQFGATIHYQTPAISAVSVAENLISYLESRSSSRSWNARISTAVKTSTPGTVERAHY